MAIEVVFRLLRARACCRCRVPLTIRRISMVVRAAGQSSYRRQLSRPQWGKLIRLELSAAAVSPAPPARWSPPAGASVAVAASALVGRPASRGRRDNRRGPASLPASQPASRSEAKISNQVYFRIATNVVVREEREGVAYWHIREDRPRAVGAVFLILAKYEIRHLANIVIVALRQIFGRCTLYFAS